MSKCIICHEKGKSIVSFCNGKHHYHMSCLLKWEKSNTKTNNNLYYKYNDRVYFDKFIKCPYCKNNINLLKNTRLSCKLVRVLNKINWILTRLSKKYNHFCDRSYNCSEWREESFGMVLENKCNELHGICDKCHNSDNISQMLVKKDSSEESWLCRRCQYDENITHIENCECELDYFKRIPINIDLFNFTISNRYAIRKDNMLKNSIITLAQLFINQLDKVKESEITENEKTLIKLSKNIVAAL